MAATAESRSGAVPDASEQRAKLGLWTKLAYGFGSVAYGVKNNGFDYFLLTFYGLVVGLDERLVGLAVLIALVFDAVSDPLVGYFSDNFRSKWGRRHPFMYASALPVAAAYFFLWNPPFEWSQTALFWYLTILSIIIRTCVTFYETPSTAMAPELTDDYDERTTLLSYRFYFGWTGGNAISVLMWGVLLVATAVFGPDPRANLDGWYTYGLIGSILIFLAIMVSSIGTHHMIPKMREAPPKRHMSIGRIFAEVWETLANKSFAALFIGALLSAIASGIGAALAFVILPLFWGFSGGQIFIWSVFVFVSAALAFIIAPMAAKRWGKKRAAITLGLCGFWIAPMPIVLRLFGLMPENGDPILFPILLAVNTIDLAMIISFSILFSSMIADLVEQSELKTARRSEGLFSAAVTFIRKSVQGFGVLGAGFIIWAADFPEQESNLRPLSADQIPADALWRLGAYYAPAILILYTLMLVAISFYKIDKNQHEDNLRALAEKKQSAGAAD
ncbi:MAG: MFS transporter [Pseudomonadota bacterium]